jgi:hypothetical protein
MAKAHLAKAYVIRLEVVMMLVVANSKHTRGKLKCRSDLKEINAWCWIEGLTSRGKWPQLCFLWHYRKFAEEGLLST